MRLRRAGTLRVIIRKSRGERNCEPVSKLWRTWLIHMQREWCKSTEAGFCVLSVRSTSQKLRGRQPKFPAFENREDRGSLSSGDIGKNECGQIPVYTVTTAFWYSS